MGYQDFGDGGDSRSTEKLARLGLNLIASAPNPLAGLSVLDIGCNEGFFCIEAVRQGATRVLGIDQNPKIIEAAKRRSDKAEFLCRSWWEIPDEQFDVIFFLSAIHYETDQKRLLAKLLQHLKPGGTLILECGIAQGNTKGWRSILRFGGPMRFPTEELLIDDLLAGFAVRKVAESVLQDGDPVPRFVYHCSPQQPTAILMPGASQRGKTVLRHQLSRHGLPATSTDDLLLALYYQSDYFWRPVSNFLRNRFPETDVAQILNKLGAAISQSEHASEFIALLCDEAPTEAGIFVIEGDALRYGDMQERLLAQLESRNIRP